MKREYADNVSGGTYGGFGPAQPGMAANGKAKMIGFQEEPDAGMDELLAALGYKVRSSDMADVAQKLEQLEMAIGSSAVQDDALLTHLASDTVHYNPSDLSNWLDNILSDLSMPVASFPPAIHSNSGALNLPPAPMSVNSSSAFFDPADNLAATASSTRTSVDFFCPAGSGTFP
ncbi:hypothetical protein HPP92_005833 [Vanilla planifolia]|uniref:Transcriptional factor DELLA N-terminal domain-containing protein n=1 Tax=Vanilla planifolia TaxID=51239 RepID=A0A835RQA3_VANPL|nr:hypothetical protein HPP92_005833 [Vanilla planifolia]